MRIRLREREGMNVCKKLNFVLLVFNDEYRIKQALYNYSEISLIVNVNFNLNIRVIGIMDSNNMLNNSIYDIISVDFDTVKFSQYNTKKKK